MGVVAVLGVTIPLMLLLALLVEAVEAQAVLVLAHLGTEVECTVETHLATTTEVMVDTFLAMV